MRFVESDRGVGASKLYLWTENSLQILPTVAFETGIGQHWIQIDFRDRCPRTLSRSMKTESRVVTEVE